MRAGENPKRVILMEASTELHVALDQDAEDLDRKAAETRSFLERQSFERMAEDCPQTATYLRLFRSAWAQ
jgi:hypothetical protein